MKIFFKYISYSIFLKGIFHSGIEGIFILIASIVVLSHEESSNNKLLITSGLFGLLAFITYSIHLFWEMSRFYRSKRVVDISHYDNNEQQSKGEIKQIENQPKIHTQIKESQSEDHQVSVCIIDTI